MTWLDLYNHLNKQANDLNFVGNFPWQEEVKVFDFGTLGYFPTDFIEMPDGKVALSVDTNHLETT